MIPGFEKIVEERIKKAQKRGDFNNLPGTGKPLKIEEDRHVPEDLRLAFKILKNSGFLPLEIELKKKIYQTEELLTGVTEGPEKYRLLKKLNFLITKLNMTSKTSISTEMPQHYSDKILEKMGEKNGK